MAENAAGLEVDEYVQGEGDAKLLNKEINTIWQDLVEKQGSELAEALGVDVAALDPKKPLFAAATVRGSGTGLEAIAIMLAVAAAKGLGIGAGGVVAAAALKKAKAVWAKHFDPKVTSSKKPLVRKKRKG